MLCSSTMLLKLQMISWCYSLCWSPRVLDQYFLGIDLISVLIHLRILWLFRKFLLILTFSTLATMQAICLGIFLLDALICFLLDWAGHTFGFMWLQIKGSLLLLFLFDMIKFVSPWGICASSPILFDNWGYIQVGLTLLNGDCVESDWVCSLDFHLFQLRVKMIIFFLTSRGGIGTQGGG